MRIHRIISKSYDGQRAQIVVITASGMYQTRHCHRANAAGMWVTDQGDVLQEGGK